jgi:hypothetical protein
MGGAAVDLAGQRIGVDVRGFRRARFSGSSATIGDNERGAPSAMW